MSVPAGQGSQRQGAPADCDRLLCSTVQAHLLCSTGQRAAGAHRVVTYRRSPPTTDTRPSPHLSRFGKWNIAGCENPDVDSWAALADDYLKGKGYNYSEYDSM